MGFIAPSLLPHHTPACSKTSTDEGSSGTKVCSDPEDWLGRSSENGLKSAKPSHLGDLGQVANPLLALALLSARQSGPHYLLPKDDETKHINVSEEHSSGAAQLSHVYVFVIIIVRA